MTKFDQLSTLHDEGHLLAVLDVAGWRHQLKCLPRDQTFGHLVDAASFDRDATGLAQETASTTTP